MLRKYPKTFSTYGEARKEAQARTEGGPNVGHLRRFDVAEKLDGQMQILLGHPANRRNALTQMVRCPADSFKHLSVKIDGKKGANHDCSKRVKRSQLRAAWEAPRMMRSRSP